MKKFLTTLLLAFAITFSNAQINTNVCDSLSYTIQPAWGSSALLVLNGHAPGATGNVLWDWQVCNDSLWFSNSGSNVIFQQFTIHDTVIVCLTITFCGLNGVCHTCHLPCDTLVWGANGWGGAQPLMINELTKNYTKDNKYYDVLGRGVFNIEPNVLYIKNNIKYMRLE